MKTFKNPRNVGWIVFEIGVVDDRDLAGSVLESRPDGGALAGIFVMTKKFPGNPPIVAARCGEGVQHRGRAIHRTIVNHNHSDSRKRLISFEHIQSG